MASTLVMLYIHTEKNGQLCAPYRALQEINPTQDAPTCLCINQYNRYRQGLIERLRRFELRPEAWKALMLPLTPQSLKHSVKLYMKCNTGSSLCQLVVGERIELPSPKEVLYRHRAIHWLPTSPYTVQYRQEKVNQVSSLGLDLDASDVFDTSYHQEQEKLHSIFCEQKLHKTALYFQQV